LLSTHYRSPIQFGEELLTETGKSLESFYRFFKRYERIAGESFYMLPYAKTRAAGDSALATAALSAEFKAEIAATRAQALVAMDDDFNTGGAIASMFDLLRALNKFGDVEKLEAPHPPADKRAEFLAATAVLRELAALLGIFSEPPKAAAGGADELVSKLLGLLIEIRATARKNKDFATADLVRKKLLDFGVSLEDRPGGTEWTRI
jgi:cysteinyl-tRNA synthetase